jgi:hypothetical protein
MDPFKYVSKKTQRGVEKVLGTLPKSNQQPSKYKKHPRHQSKMTKKGRK